MNHVKIKILNQINNPNGRVKFKDIRKVDIGIVATTLKILKRIKVCVLQLSCDDFRKKEGNTFNEYHVKLFNSGKLKSPNTDESMLDLVSSLLIGI